MLYLPASQQILLANAKTGPFILVMICSIPIKFEILTKIYYTILVLRILVFIYNHIPYVKDLILYLKIDKIFNYIKKTIKILYKSSFIHNTEDVVSF